MTEQPQDDHALDHPRTSGKRPHVVIVGGGFAGVAAVDNLAGTDVDITLIDRNSYNTFQPLLYQVTAGGLNPGDVTYSLRALAANHENVRYRHGNVTRINALKQLVALNDGDRIHYDYLVIATGVTANFFGVPGAKERSHIIYTRRDAIATRDHLFSRLETLAQSEGKDAEVNIVVVGAGATGTEVAGAMAEMARTALPKSYPELDPNKIRVYLVEMTENCLPPFNEKVHKYTGRALERRGVLLKMNTSVEKVTAEEVFLSDGSEIPTKTIIWCTGVTAPDYVSRWRLPQGRGGRILIDPQCRVVGFPNIFAAGDVAADSMSGLPQLAQPAMQQGEHIAKNIRHYLAGEQLEDFGYHDKGIMATIGRNAAVAQLPNGTTLTGLPAFAAWVGLHILVLMSYRNRVAVLSNLAWRYFNWKKSFNVIVGDVYSERRVRRNANSAAFLDPEEHGPLDQPGSVMSATGEPAANTVAAADKS